MGMKKLRFGALACVGLVALFFVQWQGCGPLQPGDWMLKLRYQLHRSELARIVAMLHEDPQMTRIASDFLWTQDNVAWPRPESQWGITNRRWDDYREIFKQANFEAGAARRGNDVKIFVWSWGIVAGGSIISYLHCGSPTSGETGLREPACLQQNETGRGYY